MALEGVKLFGGLGVPDFAGTVVAACDEFVAVFVEGAVGQRQRVAL